MIIKKSAHPVMSETPLVSIRFWSKLKLTMKKVQMAVVIVTMRVTAFICRSDVSATIAFMFCATNLLYGT